MASKLDRDLVQQVAALAHLTLTDAEAAGYSADLSAMIEYAASVLEVDTTGVSPTSHPLGLEPVIRDDQPGAARERTAYLEGAPDADIDAVLFRVPRVVRRDE